MPKIIKAIPKPKIKPVPKKPSLPKPPPVFKPKEIPRREPPPICTPGQIKLLTNICKALKEEHGISLRQIRATVEYLLDQTDGRIQ